MATHVEPTYAILLVDDQVIETQTIRMVISQSRLPLRVSTATNGEAALDLLRSDSFDILLTDIKMPRMNGLDLARHARLIHPSIQLIVYSAFGEFEYAREAIDLGAIHYMLKPLDLDEFALVMDKALERCQASRALEVKDRDEAELPETEDADDSKRKVVRDVQALVQTHYSDPALSVDFLASQVFLSASYLGHLYKSHTGHNLGKHIIAVRMQNAKQLLATTHRKVADISQAVGYPNPSYFSMLFRMHFGCTPVQYREQGEPK